MNWKSLLCMLGMSGFFIADVAPLGCGGGASNGPAREQAEPPETKTADDAGVENEAGAAATTGESASE